MELWISGTIEEVAEAANSGIAAKIATNPTLIAEWTKDGRTLEDVIEDVTSRVDVPVYVQLRGPDVKTLLNEMNALAEISPLVQPKLVATHAGIVAAYQLADKGFRPLVTAVTTVNQAFMAASVEANYVAPYFGRIKAAGRNPVALIEEIRKLYTLHNSETQIVAASIHDPEEAHAALLAGAHAIVVFYDVMMQLTQGDLTQQAIEGFERDWSTFVFQSRADDLAAEMND